ncbi:MAG: hypothetical protein LBR56_05650 [Sporomusaceae bacterium]|jgi:hypothetical protein|nr:hypothetical protein [Sporomusaceae bacterium]
MTTANTHPKYELPDDPHAKHRYESAKKHANSAKEAGKSSDEIHAIFKKVMAFDSTNLDQIPQDDAHKNYRLAMIHAKAAQEAGKTPEEVHKIFNDIKTGKSTGTH